MVTPNMPSSAQDIINNFLSGGYSTAAQANPYRVDVDPFRPPVDTPDDTPETDPCPEGYVYDPVMKRCMPIDEVDTGDRPEEIDREKMLFDRMKKDPNTIFGASNILDDYLIDTKGSGDILLRFDPSVNAPPPIFGLGLLDLFGGAKRRENTFNDALQTFTDAGYGQQLNDGTYQIFNPQQYFNTVQNNPLQGVNTSGGASTMTVGQAVDSVMNPQPQSGESRGSPIAEDMSGGLLGRSPLTSVDTQGNRSRNDTAYRAAVARNIESNKKKFGTSGFTEGIGFTRGR